MYVIYKIEFPNQKTRIGQTVNLKNRMRDYRYGSVNVNVSEYNSPMSRAIRKYGWDNLVITILQECRTKTDANRIETDFIQLFRSYDRQRGYNIKQFVDGRGRNKLSRSHKRKISMGHLGKKHSKETKEKISKSWINRTVSEETKRKMSITHTRINKLNRKYNGKN